MFTVEFRKILPHPSDYTRYMSHIIRPLSGSKLIKDDIQSGGIFEYIYEMCMKVENNEHMKNDGYKISAINLLCDIWILYPYKFEKDSTLGNGVLSMMKRTTRQCNNIMKISIYTHLFDLLHRFAGDRNPYAPVIYKILVFSYIENYTDKTMREYISYNMRYVIDSIHTLPIDILIDPLSRQYNILSSDDNIYIYDILLLRSIVLHNRLSIQSSIILFDVLSRLLLISYTYILPISNILISLVRRYIENDIYNEYIIKFISVCLSYIYKSFNTGGVMRLDDDRRLDNIYNGMNMNDDEVVNELKVKHKRTVVINTIRDILMLKQSKINSSIDNRLLYTNREIHKLIGYHYKGVLLLLKIVYNNDDVNIKIEEYDKEMNIIDRVKSSNVIKNNYIDNDNDNNREKETDEYRKEILGINDDDINTKRESMRGIDNDDIQYKDMNNDMYDIDVLSDDEYDDMKKKYGLNIGIKDRKRDNEKSNIDGKKKGNKIWEKDVADHRMRKYLEDLKNKKEKVRLKSIEKEIAKKIKEDKINKQLNGELGWRKKLMPSNEHELFLDYGIGELYQKGLKSDPLVGFIPIDNIDIGEEYIDKEYINTIYYKYRNQFQYIFKKYANTIPDKSIGSFDMIGKRANSLSIPEVMRMLNDYFITDYIDKTEVASLIRISNDRGSNKDNNKYLDSDSFYRFISNVAVLIHTRPPLSMNDLSYPLMITSLLDMIDKARSMKGDEQPNFNNNRSVKYMQDKDMIELMNYRLQEDPEYALPPVRYILSCRILEK